jgi:hypothetical protein
MKSLPIFSFLATPLDPALALNGNHLANLRPREDQGYQEPTLDCLGGEGMPNTPQQNQ